MMPLVETGAGAFLAGLAVSPHCGVMCAPLTCALGPWKGTADQRLGFAVAYHVSRTGAYTAAGALAGLIGAGFGRALATPLVTYLPWAMVAFLVLLAVGFDRGIPLPAFVRKRQGEWAHRSQDRSPWASGASLGLMSPLLPCGPLHALLGLCLLSSSALRGAELALGFALGTVPLLWVAQLGYHRLSLRLGTARAQHVRRALAGLAGLVLAIKLIWFSADSGVCL